MRTTLNVCSIVVLLNLTALPPSHTTAEETKSTAPSPVGLKSRTLWTTSNFRGRPEPPLPYRAQRVFTKLRFEHPTLLTNAPGTDRLFIAQIKESRPRGAQIFSIPNDQECEQADLFLDMDELVSRLKKKTGEKFSLVSVYGLTFHPNFAENRYCYLCYVVRDRNRSYKEQHPNGTRVVRLTVSKTDPPRCRSRQ